MAKKKPKLNPIEAKILTVLIQNEWYMNTAEVAKESNVSWNTALAYLMKMYKKGWVDRQSEGTSISWRAIVNPDNL